MCGGTQESMESSASEKIFIGGILRIAYKEVKKRFLAMLKGFPSSDASPFSRSKVFCTGWRRNSSICRISSVFCSEKAAVQKQPAAGVYLHLFKTVV